MKRWIATPLLSLLLLACSSEEDGAGEKVSVRITAADGGTVEIGKAALTIPAGALAEDTTITAETKTSDGMPDSGTLEGLAYDFGPDGLQFLQPVTLELPMEGSPGSGKEAVISWLDGNTWVDVPSSASGGKVSAEITHFTTFIVRFKNAGSVSCDFSACGGDLVGTWNIQGMCGDIDDRAFSQLCPTTTIDVEIDGSGTITFNDDSTYAVDLTISGTAEIVFPKECTATLGSCAALLGEDPDDPVCTGEPATGCTCVASLDDATDDSGTYSTSGSQVTIGDGNPASYCVSGDTLKVKTTSGSGGPSFVFTATR